ncbi:hypothetical protein HYW84_04465, partial [Candidatus Peregrinibacteria bacterium]|nr:hypothetical protein [Candidatus Peregrinibacteria bacterium]
ASVSVATPSLLQAPPTSASDQERLERERERRRRKRRRYRENVKKRKDSDPGPGTGPAPTTIIEPPPHPAPNQLQPKAPGARPDGPAGLEAEGITGPSPVPHSPVQPQKPAAKDILPAQQIAAQAPVSSDDKVAFMIKAEGVENRKLKNA